jgi:putative membrane protein
VVTARSPLGPAERRRIDAALAAAEQRTDAHFALAVVSASDRYALFPLAWAAVLAVSLMGILALLKPALSIGEGFLVNAGSFILLALVLDWRPLRLRLVPATIKQSHARVLAHREFASRILADARHRHGVLFFVSLGERYVEVLADRETHARVAPGTWEKLVADFIAAVKADRLAEGFGAATEACSMVLSAHYPPTVGAPNT